MAAHHPASEHMQRLRRRAQRRAIADMLIVAAMVPAVAMLAGDGHGALMLGVAALSLGILFVVIRRGRDAMDLARADRWRADAIAGRGMSMADWQGGKELAGWDARRAPQPDPGEDARRGVAMEI